MLCLLYFSPVEDKKINQRSASNSNLSTPSFTEQAGGHIIPYLLNFFAHGLICPYRHWSVKIKLISIYLLIDWISSFYTTPKTSRYYYVLFEIISTGVLWGNPPENPQHHLCKNIFLHHICVFVGWHFQNLSSTSFFRLLNCIIHPFDVFHLSCGYM